MLAELKTFLMVARSGTLTAAGLHLGLTQSAVSAQMRRLEGLMHQPLFDRTGRSVSLNDAGRSIVPLAEQMLALEEQLVSGATLASGGSLRIGAVTTVQKGLLNRALAQFRQRHPDARVRIVPGVSLDLLGQVDADQIDLAVMIRPPFALPPGLTWRQLAREPYVLVVPAGTLATDWREVLTRMPFIRYDRASFGGRQVEQFLHKHRVAVHDAIELDDPEAALGLVAQGLGVALLPAIEPMVDRSAAPVQVEVMELGESVFFRELGVLTRDAGATPVSTDLVACLLAQAPAAAEASR